MRKRIECVIKELMHNWRKILPVFIVGILLLSVFSVAAYTSERDLSKAKKNKINKEKVLLDKVLAQKKEEVIYARLAASGAVKDVYIVNSFLVDEDKTIKDYGNYSQVENLSDLNPLELEGDTVRAEVKKGRFYYQGDLADRDLPWKIDITYTLNGAEKSAEEIGGAEGEIGIQIKTEKNPHVDPLYYERYILVTSVTLNAEICEHIKAKGALIANAGSDKMLNFIALPEQDSTFNISLESANFSMKGIAFAALPATLDADMLAFSQFDEMIGGLKQLADGIAQLNNGAQLLRGGSKQFKDGLDQLSAGGAQLAAGSAQINDLFQMIKKKVQQFGKLDENFLKDLREDLERVYNWLIKVQKEFKKIADLIDKEKLTSAFVPISEADLLKASAELTALAKKEELSEATLKVYKQLLADYLVAASIDQLLKNNEQIQKWNDQFLSDLKKCINCLASIQIPTPEQMMKMLDMITMFADQFQMFHDGLVQYTGGVTALANGYKEIDGGIAGLAAGTKELNRQTSSLPKQVKDGINEMLKKYTDPNFKPLSFASAKNGKIDTVQFVLATEGIEGLHEDTGDVNIPEEKGFWEKFLDLFK